MPPTPSAAPSSRAGSSGSSENITKLRRAPWAAVELQATRPSQDHFGT